jgi:hypothetical protein
MLRLNKFKDEVNFFRLIAGQDAKFRVVLMDRIRLFFQNSFNCANIAASGLQLYINELFVSSNKLNVSN